MLFKITGNRCTVVTIKWANEYLKIFSILISALENTNKYNLNKQSYWGFLNNVYDVSDQKAWEPLLLALKNQTCLLRQEYIPVLSLRKERGRKERKKIITFYRSSRFSQSFTGHCWNNWEYLSTDCLLSDNINFVLISL